MTVARALLGGSIFAWLLIFGLAACPGEDPAGGGDAGCPNDLPPMSVCSSPIPSYTTDIAPILQKHCLMCHSPGGVSAAWDLTTYPNVHTLEGQVLSQVYSCRMPYPDGGLPLSPEERKELLTWLVCDAPNN